MGELEEWESGEQRQSLLEQIDPFSHVGEAFFGAKAHSFMDVALISAGRDGRFVL